MAVGGQPHGPQLTGEERGDAVVVLARRIDRRDTDQLPEAPQERCGMAVDVSGGRHGPRKWPDGVEEGHGKRVLAAGQAVAGA